MVDSDSDQALAPLNDALRRAFAKAQEELGIDSSALIMRLEEQGCDDFVADAVEFPWARPVYPDRAPASHGYFDAAVKAGRLDLTIESNIRRLVASVPHWELFFGSRLERATARLDLAERLLKAQRSLDSGSGSDEFPVVLDAHWICPAGDRAYLVRGIFCSTFETDSEDLEGIPGCASLAAAERQLSHTPWLDYSPASHNHLLFCEHCQSTQTVFAEIHEFLVDEELRLCREHLEILDEQIRNSAPFGRSRSGERYRKARDWRTVVLADYLGFSGDMAKYCSAEQRGRAGFHPWMNLRNGDGASKAAAFVQGLSKDLFNTALLAFEIQSQRLFIFPMLMADGPFLVPSCGDIREVKGLLQPVVTWDTSSWRNWIDDEQFVSGPPSKTTAADLLDMAADAALARSRALKPPSPAPTLTRNAEHMARHAVRPEIFDRLCKVSRDLLIDAETMLLTKGLRDYGPVVRSYATAFEVQVEESILGPIRSARKHESGAQGSMPGLPLPLRDWPFEHDKVSLFELRNVLQSNAPRFKSKITELGIDVKLLFTAIEEVRLIRNRVTHPEDRCSFTEACEIKNAWLSRNRPDNPNIFKRILPNGTV